MFKLALSLVLLAGCAESVNNKEPPSVPTGVQQAIPSDPSPAIVSHHESRTAVIRDSEPRSFYVPRRDPSECWQCRR